MDIQAIGAASRATSSMGGGMATMRPAFIQESTSAATEASGVGKFGTLLEGVLENASAAEKKSDGLVEKMARGEPVDIHRVMSAVTEADLSFRMVMEIRNKLMEAWQTIQRMPV